MFLSKSLRAFGDSQHLLTNNNTADENVETMRREQNRTTPLFSTKRRSQMITRTEGVDIQSTNKHSRGHLANVKISILMVHYLLVLVWGEKRKIQPYFDQIAHYRFSNRD